MSDSMKWAILGGLAVLVLMRSKGAQAQAGLTRQDVAAAVPMQAGAMALDMWRKAHAGDVGLSSAAMPAGPAGRAVAWGRSDLAAGYVS